MRICDQCQASVPSLIDDLAHLVTENHPAAFRARTKVHDRVLRPLMAGDQPQAPPPLRAALRVIDGEVTRRIAAARLPAAA